MKKVLIISDTHGYHTFFDKVVEMEKPFDLMLHMGDTEGGEDYMKEAAGCPCYFVSGNNDFWSDTPFDQIIDYEGRRIFMTHGHGFYVSMNTERLKKYAREVGADIVMFGHIHRPVLEQDENGMILLNPGSLQFPRQRPRRPSYMVMEIEHGGECKIELKYAN